MDLRKLKTLIDLVAESAIAEIEVTEGEDKVRIVKHANAPTMPPSAAVSAFSTAPLVAPPAAPPEVRWKTRSRPPKAASSEHSHA